MKNTHPTVKPRTLMRWLAGLTATPIGGVVLDPFMGTGSTGLACLDVNRQFIGIELESKSFEIAKLRLKAAIEDVGLIQPWLDDEREEGGI